MTEPYERLANAIILSAVRDYRTALRTLKRNPDSRGAMDTAMELERFFRSGWYGELTSVDGEYLIQRLRDEVNQS